MEEQEFTEYEDLDHNKLVKKVHDLEDQVDELRRSLELFRDQVQKWL